MMNKIKICFKLFSAFFKIGAFTIGGGYAMLPIIQREVAEKNNWIDESVMIDIVAIAESTPGPIAINTATFVGTKVAGFWGAFSATFGTVLPSFLIISFLSKLLGYFMEYEAVKFAFVGIRAGVIALIVKALWGMAKKCPKNLFSLIMSILAFVIALFVDGSVLYIILGGAIIGLAVGIICKQKGEKR